MPPEQSGRRRPPKPPPQKPVVAAPVLGVGGDPDKLVAESTSSNPKVSFDRDAFFERLRKVAATFKSYREADRAAGLHAGGMGQYARGKRVPGADAVASICIAAGVDPAWLLLGIGEMYGPPPGDESTAASEAATNLDARSLRQLHLRLAAMTAHVDLLEQQLASLRGQLASMEGIVERAATEMIRARIALPEGEYRAAVEEYLAAARVEEIDDDT